MCGLAGIFNLGGAPVDPDVLVRMRDSLAHRGPDDKGLAIIDSRLGDVTLDPVKAAGFDLGLAGRRLSIIDLSPAGRMPMSSHDGRIWLVYNGEIYNYVELRRELSSKGHQFRTKTDTEVIIQAYREWGMGCQDRFNGMWAFALFDLKRGKLFCSRDRMGIKPFYYFHDNRVFVFGSEIKALLEHPDVPGRPDYHALFNYLGRSYRFVDGRPTTFFDGISQLEAGCCLTVGRDGLDIKRYWDIDPARGAEHGEDKALEQKYLEILQDSVKLRLRSDVDVACQLSGGLDSSAAAALAAREKGPGLHVFSACYDQKPFDEREYIQPTVDAIRADSTCVFPKADGLLKTLPHMIRAFDEPVCTVTFYAHWRVMAEAARQGFKVVLNGHGADELAAGYYDHFLHHFADMKAAGANGRLTGEIKAWLGNHGGYRQKHLDDYFDLVKKGVPYMRDYLNFFAPYESAMTADFADSYRNEKPDESPFPSILTNRLYNELKFETVPAVLKAEDRVTMAHSIESRLPFLDYRLVEFMFTVPGSHKIRNGLNKFIQREALRGVIPESVRNRVEKVGFNAPSEAWFRSELKGAVSEAINDSRLCHLGILNNKALKDLWQEHQNGQANHYQFLWQVLNAEIWLREYFDHAALP